MGFTHILSGFVFIMVPGVPNTLDLDAGEPGWNLFGATTFAKLPLGTIMFVLY